MTKNKFCEIFQIEHPIVSGGMVWCSGWRLASAVSECGGLGLLGAGSMHPDLLREHIQKCKAATKKPFGVNVPLMYPQIEEIITIIEQEKVPVVFTSAGNPGLYTSRLKASGCKVVHVVSSTKFALKAEAAGVDAVVAEGFEAGGHNGKEETTTMVLVPAVAGAVKIPVLAAGGIATARQMAAAMILGADGVQIGTRFALSAESSASDAFKSRARALAEGDTMLCLKKLSAVRMIKNDIYNKIAQAESAGAGVDTLKELISSHRAKFGIFEGDLNEGFLEIGQTATLVTQSETVSDIFNDLTDYQSFIKL